MRVLNYHKSRRHSRCHSWKCLSLTTSGAVALCVGSSGRADHHNYSDLTALYLPGCFTECGEQLLSMLNTTGDVLCVLLALVQLIILLLLLMLPLLFSVAGVAAPAAVAAAV
eukprot:scpid111859/ scgid14156/ 